MTRIGITAVARGIPETTVQRFSATLPQREDIVVEIVRGKAAGAFSLARDKNEGIRRLLAAGCETIVATDIDMLVPPGLIEATANQTAARLAVWCLCRDVETIGSDRPWAEWLSLPVRAAGRGSWVSMTADDWRRCGGFDERCVGWGGDDDVLAARRKTMGIETLAMRQFALMHVAHEPYAGWHLRDGRANLDRCLTSPPRCNYLTDAMPTRESDKIVTVMVTNQCPNRCKHCSQQHLMRRDPEYQMTAEQARTLARCCEASDTPIPEIIVTGGEPLCWDILESAIECWSDCRAIERVSMFTSARNIDRLTPGVLDRLHRVRVSQYRHNEQQIKLLRSKYGAKIQVSEQRRHTPLPDGPIAGSVPGWCSCQGVGVYGDTVFACPNLAPVQAQSGIDYGWSEPIGPNFLGIMRGWRHGTHEPCAMCVSNRRVRDALGSVEH